MTLLRANGLDPVILVSAARTVQNRKGLPFHWSLPQWVVNESMSHKKIRSNAIRSNDAQRAIAKHTLRIIGGDLRGRHFTYSGDPRTRPMKDQTRQAVFNLVGGWVPGKQAIDLFAGTGALGLEALSRGAKRAIFIERHIPSAKLIRDNVHELGLVDRATIETGDTFFWARQFLKQKFAAETPAWAVFCCPPYSLFADQADEITAMLRSLVQAAPKQSVFVVESDDRFNPDRLPNRSQWRVHVYRPTIIYVLRPSTAPC